jgi:hypothetical protein
VVAGGCEAVTPRVVGADQVMVRDLMTGAVQQIPIRTLQQAPASGTEPRHQTDLSLIGDEAWAIARCGTRSSNRCSMAGFCREQQAFLFPSYEPRLRFGGIVTAGAAEELSRSVVVRSVRRPPGWLASTPFFLRWSSAATRRAIIPQASTCAAILTELWKW